VREGARVFGAPLASNFDAVSGHLLALLTQDRDDINRRAASERY